VHVGGVRASNFAYQGVEQSRTELCGRHQRCRYALALHTRSLEPGVRNYRPTSVMDEAPVSGGAVSCGTRLGRSNCCAAVVRRPEPESGGCGFREQRWWGSRRHQDFKSFRECDGGLARNAKQSRGSWRRYLAQFRGGTTCTLPERVKITWNPPGYRPALGPFPGSFELWTRRTDHQPFPVFDVQPSLRRPSVGSRGNAERGGFVASRLQKYPVSSRPV
jgi:hypothetical protein